MVDRFLLLFDVDCWDAHRWITYNVFFIPLSLMSKKKHKTQQLVLVCISSITITVE